MTQAAVEDFYPLSPLQQGLLFHHLYEPSSSAYFEQLTWGVSGPLDRPALLAAWQRAIERHGVLRTAFLWQDLDSPVQVVHRAVTLPFEELDWSDLPEPERAARLEAFLAQDRARGFDLTRPPLMRLALICLDPGQHLMVWSHHHLILDGWSVTSLLAEVGVIYEALSQGHEPVLPAPPPPYRNYLRWLHRQDLAAAERYWRCQLGRVVEPTPLPLASEPGGAPPGADYGRAAAFVSAAGTRALEAFARQWGLTLNTLVVGAWALFLARFAGQEEAVLGVTVSGRPAELPGVESILGVFINTLPLRVAVGDRDRLGEWLVGLQRRQAEMRAYEYSPLASVQGWSALPPGQRLFSSILVFQNRPVAELSAGSDVGSSIGGLSFFERTDYPLTLMSGPGPRLWLEALFETRCYDPATIRGLLERFRCLLEGLPGQGDQPLGRISLLSSEERHQLLNGWNATERPYQGAASLAALVEAQAERTPAAPALVAEGETWSYAELMARALSLAAALARRGAGVESRVAVCLPRGPWMAAAVLATLRAGAAYVPLDPSYPAERLALMLGDSGAALLVSVQELAARLPASELPTLWLDRPGPAEVGAPAPPLAVPSEALAYVIFTSGSTGRPKGVAMTQGALLNLLAWQLERSPRPAARTLQLAPLSFDVSFQEMLSTWAAGGCLVLASEGQRRDPEALLEHLERQRVERLFLPFVALRQLAEAAALVDRVPPDLREVITAGEQLRVTPEIARFFARLPAATLDNQYGPSESHVVTAYRLAGESADWPALPPIGRPIANARCRVLDRTLEPVPAGVPGELWLGGACLGRGYLGRPGLTAERFLPDPHAARPGERLYRTGDLARHRADGEVEFLGRVDEQVKVRGYRVEPGEVEAALGQLPGIRQATVTARQDGDGGRSLVAFLVADGPPLAVAELRARLLERLPEFMVPAALVFVEAIPLTPSGKVDRRALPVVALGREALGTELVPPRTPLERVVAEIYQEVLGVERVGALDDFFLLGGHSLKAIQVATRARRAIEAEVSLRLVFEHPTVEGLARALGGLVGGGLAVLPPIPAREPAPTAPLTYSQERLWFLDQLEPGQAAYNIPLTLRLAGSLDIAALAAALAEVVARHQILRTVFESEAGQPVQRVLPARPVRLPVVDLSGLRAEPRGEVAAVLLERAVRAPFDLGRGPLMRQLLLREAAGRHVLLAVQHHIVSDGWSLGLLKQEISQLYSAFAARRPSPLAPPSRHYADFAVWQRRWLRDEALAAELAYWREALAGAPTVLELPTDHPRPAVLSHRGAQLFVGVEPAATARLAELAQREGATPFMALLGVFGVLLGRWSGQDDLLVGTPIANRNRAELEGMIGFLVNTLVLRVRLGSRPSFAGLLGRLRETTLGAYAHQDVPFEQLVEELAPERHLNRSPLFQAMLILQNAPEGEGDLPGLETSRVRVGTASAKFDLTLSLEERRDGGLAGYLEYSTDLFEEATLARLWRGFETLLGALAAGSAEAVEALPCMPAAEREQLVRELGAGPVAPIPKATLPGRFFAQARRTPEATAVWAGGREVRYRELAEQAARVRDRLLARGLAPEQPVAVCLGRRPELLAVALGAMAAGGVYLPLDPRQPPARLAGLVADARPALVIVEAATRALAGAAGLPVVEVEALLAEPAAGRELEVSPMQAAYVIFTSGSTGRPKGVVVEHRAIVNRLAWGQRAYPLEPADRVALIASIGFDFSIWELFAPLVVGASVVLPAAEDVLALAVELEATGTTVAHFVPSVLQALVETGRLAALGQLRLLFAGGEALPRELARRVVAETGARLWNQYGPTEATVDATALRCEPEALAAGPAVVPIGGPIDNLRALVCGPDGRLQPLGVPGELVLGGVGLARGYLARPGLTAERFVPDPEAANPGQRRYRTGDRVRWGPSGALEFLGRLDQQVKLRGVRIELGEVEHALRQLPGVREAAVLLAGEGSAARLVAYFVGEAEGAELAAALARQLPEVMVPGLFVRLEGLPRSAAGKLDRRALPAPAEPAAVPGAPLEGEVEEVLGELFGQLLGHPRVTAGDDFFALGGHSLLAARLVHAIGARLGVAVPLRTLFQTPTLGALAAEVRRLRASRGEGELDQPLPTLVPDPSARFEPFAMTEVQQAYWVGRSGDFELGNVAPHSYVEYDLRGLDLERFEAALRSLIERHDLLRAVVRPDGRMQVLSEVPAYRLERHDLRGLPAAEGEARLAALRERLSHQVLDASRWPLFELHATLLEDGVIRLHVSTDALIRDGWSMWLLMGELRQAYRQPERRLPPLELSFRDYVLAEQALRTTPLYARALESWRGRLADLPAGPELPLERDPSTVARPTFVRWTASLDADPWRRLKARVGGAGLTPSAFILAAFSRVLAAWCKSPRFTLVLTLFNRLPLHPQVNALVGDFTSTVLLAVEDAAAGTFEAAGRRLQDRLWHDLDHRLVSGVTVLRELARARGVLAGGLFPVVVTSTLGLHDEAPGAAGAKAGGESGVEARVVFHISQTPQVWLDHQVLEHEGRLVFNWDVVAELFPPGLIDAMFDAYRRLLAELAAGEEAWTGARRPLVGSDWLEVVAGRDRSAEPVPEGLMHGPIAEQARRRPEAPAVIAPDLTLSYRQLDRLANRLARRLLARGARRNALVAVVMEKGWEQAVATLAILRAGAAYLPIDPGYPAERLRSLLEIGEASLALTQPWLEARLGWPAGVSRLVVEAEATAEEDDAPPVVQQEPGDLAYVIFTSGSTGQPKGVMIDHRGALNTLLEVNRRFDVGPEDRVLAVSALNFDLSVWDLFGILAAGGAVVVPAAADERDPAHWLERITTQRVTVWNTVPALMVMLVEYLAAREGRRPDPLRLALLSGDWLPLGLPERLWELAPGLSIVSLGGATEASIWSILYPIERVDPAWKSIPYGSAMAGQSLSVRDSTLEVRPPWVPGELYVGGAGLALGYWRDAERTAAAFVRHPRTGERLYRTGDLGRYFADGIIEFLGREDLQVKVRGYRIELGEVEASLLQHPAVAAAVAGAVGEGNRRTVVAWLVWQEGQAAEVEGVRAFVAQRLPPYMVPSSLEVLEALPLTANGKVDRAALARRAASAAAPAGAFSAEITATGRRVAALVAAELGRAEVDASATLIEIGATSLDLVRIANRLEDELGFRPRMDQMLRLPLGEAVLAFYEQRLASGDPAAGAPAPEAVPAATTPQGGATYTVLRDPEERARFKKRRLALRDPRPEAELVRLDAGPSVEALAPRFLTRRSRRQFAAEAVPLAALSRLFGGLRQLAFDGEPKYLYGSAGGVYPVQTYLYAKPGGVAGLEPGAYYYHPLHHRFDRLPGPQELGAEAFGWLNAPVFERASFALFLVAELAAMGPMYGALSERFCWLEAGAMTQVLETEAPECGLGLCQIGWLELPALERVLGLAGGQLYLHGLLGGALDALEEAQFRGRAERLAEWEEGAL